MSFVLFGFTHIYRAWDASRGALMTSVPLVTTATIGNFDGAVSITTDKLLRQIIMLKTVDFVFRMLIWLHLIDDNDKPTSSNHKPAF